LTQNLGRPVLFGRSFPFFLGALGVEANPTGDMRYIYRFAQDPAPFLRQDNHAQSPWAAQIGVRLSF
jgi:hypothetical protein